MIEAARLSAVDRKDLWLDQTWDEPELREPRATDDDGDVTGPWPVAETG